MPPLLRVVQGDVGWAPTTGRKNVSIYFAVGKACAMAYTQHQLRRTLNEIFLNTKVKYHITIIDRSQTMAHWHTLNTITAVSELV